MGRRILSLRAVSSIVPVSVACSWTRSWRTCRHWPRVARPHCWTTLPICSSCGRPMWSRAGLRTRRITSSRKSLVVTCPPFKRCSPSRRHSMLVSRRLSMKASITSPC
uniref:Putative secreted protein n=1 Tax=Anopheles triannulatus TaxID=58253 RepID=A0A2M4B2P3_9DIPT